MGGKKARKLQKQRAEEDTEGEVVLRSILLESLVALSKIRTLSSDEFRQLDETLKFFDNRMGPGGRLVTSGEFDPMLRP